MGAFVRSVKTSSFHGGAGLAARGDARPGDVLLMFQSADAGGNAQLDVLTGDWNLIDYYPDAAWPGEAGGFWSGAIVWAKACGQGEPTAYTVLQGDTADGVYIVAAIAGADIDSIISDNRSGSRSPSVVPSAAPGIVFRYAAGVPVASGASISWQHPTGTTELAEVQSATWVAAALASTPLVSTASTGSAQWSGSGVIASCAFTVTIAATEEPSAPPPVVQPGAPGRGRATWRYRVIRLLDRTYLGDLGDLITGVDFDRRILSPGVFNGTIPIPSRRIADRVAEIIPREAIDDPDNFPIDRGPGVIAIEVLRLGEPYGEYWVTGARGVRSRRGTYGISLRGNTLEAYLNQVEIEADLSYTADQIDIGRNVLTHLMAQPNANISLALEPGTSGTMRSVTWLETDGATYGRRLVDLAQQSDGFEWMINLELIASVLTRRWVWGAPRLGQAGVPHLWADGKYNGDILEYTEDADALRGFTRARARGNSISTDASEPSVPLLSTWHNATAHLAAGHPRTSRTLSYPTQTDPDTLEAYAAYWVARTPGTVRVDSATVSMGREVTFTPNNLGDYGRFYLRNAWHPGVWRTRRIIGIGITPTSKQSRKEEAKLVLESVEAS